MYEAHFPNADERHLCNRHRHRQRPSPALDVEVTLERQRGLVLPAEFALEALLPLRSPQGWKGSSMNTAASLPDAAEPRQRDRRRRLSGRGAQRP